MTPSARALPHILVVDDSGGVRRKVERMLAPYVRVTLAESVPDALRALTPCMQLVLSDVQMPGESGLELAAILKRQRPDLPVILCTGVVDVETRSRAQALGVEAVLRKPLLSEPLLKVIRQWLGRETGEPGHPAPAQLAAVGPASVPEAPVLPTAAPASLPQESVLLDIDPLDELCRQPGVLSAAQLDESGIVQRQWNLPLPPELGHLAVNVLAGVYGVAGELGSVWPPGQFLQVQLLDRVWLVGRWRGQRLTLVVRDEQVAGRVLQRLQALGDPHQV
ncbi:response regulator [Deinococcus fonticola]|uniref:response regulator n=1 Tax=Deinococcus fonticola TaxID=2528713 RepID=UPI001074CF82|nr:response regulator [Deinococcus fonticola]